ncbi:uncharacterized protein EV420DRAFT_1037999 [Desarmillaria tabescens]|uniref:Uncharacterized protein n=1 Tax=Armillaria tabescens TaxID=1929756 RepID=A0AA39TV49_ARMTA|nr:uncharacterized protein EV420DRAFT_1037999 [Desarmillaria tabescens]KAK0464354.1 hypothetical protein EV420DRAFT_1037999 [Desarmillaria tabescens]
MARSMTLLTGDTSLPAHCPPFCLAPGVKRARPLILPFFPTPMYPFRPEQFGEAHITRQALRNDGAASGAAPRQAPSIPKEVVARREQPRYLDYRARMMTLDKDTDGGLAGLLEKVKEWADQAPGTESPHLRDRRERVMEKYELSVLAVCPTMSVNDLWLDTTIHKYTTMFLHLVVQCTRGRKSERIKATTLLHTGRMFAYCIAKYCRNKDGEATGMKELCQGGLFRLIENYDAFLIEKYDLPRFSTERPRFGKLEILLLIREALKNTETYGPCRVVAIQRIIICLISFFTGVRPSTLGPSHKLYKTQGKYMRLEDVRIFTTGKPLQFRVILRTNAYKGHNGTVGQERRIVLNPVQNWYNLAFDVSFYIVMHLYSRHALKGVKDFDTLRHFKGSEIPIEDTMKRRPFLLAMDPGGRNLIEDEPIMATAVSSSYRTLCRNACLPSCGTYSTRRGVADYYNTAMGKSAAEIVLGHFQSGCLSSYVRGIEGIDMVGHALEELPEALSPNVKHALELHSIHSVAVTAIVVLFQSEQHSPLQNESEPEPKSKTGNEITNQITLTEAQMLEIETSPEMCELADAAAKALDAFKSLYENTKSQHSAGAKYDTIGQLHNFIKASDLRQGVDKETVDKLLKEAKDTAGALRKKRQQLRKNTLSAVRRSREENIATVEPGTFDERAKALQMLRSQDILALGPSATASDIRSRILQLRDEQLKEMKTLPEKERLARLASQEEEEEGDEGDEEVQKDPRLKNILSVIHAKSTAAAKRNAAPSDDDDDNEQTVSSTIDDVPFEECDPSQPSRKRHSKSSQPPLRLVVRDLSYQEHDETVPDDIIPCDDEQVRVALWNMLMAPVVVSQEIDKMAATRNKKVKGKPKEKDTYICEQCLLFKHDSVRSERLWRRDHLQRHLMGQSRAGDDLRQRLHHF